MGAVEDQGQGLKDGAKELAQRAKESSWVDGVARLGYGVRGVIYGLVGLFTIWLLLRGREQFMDQNEVLSAIAGQPFGKLFLIVIAVGAAGMILWTIILAVADPYRSGSSATGILARLGHLVTGSTYVILLVSTLDLIFGAGRITASGDQQTQQAAAGVLAQPWGPWLIGAAGLAMVVIALVKFRRGWLGQFLEEIKDYDLNEQQRTLIVRLGKASIIAQGMVVAILGVLMILAALTVDPYKVGGLDGALTYLAQRPYGAWLLALVAAGLIVYAVFSILGALWFKFKEL